MRIAVLSDIHANLPALQAVLRDVADAGAERLVFGGDTVGYGAHPKECLDLVRRLGGESVFGNHDHYTVVFSRQPRQLREPGIDDDSVMAGIAHAVRELDEDAVEWLRGSPWMLRLDGPAVLAPRPWITSSPRWPLASARSKARSILSRACSQLSPPWATSTSNRPARSWRRSGRSHFGQHSSATGSTGNPQSGQRLSLFMAWGQDSISSTSASVTACPMMSPGQRVK